MWVVLVQLLHDYLIYPFLPLIVIPRFFNTSVSPMFTFGLNATLITTHASKKWTW